MNYTHAGPETLDGGCTEVVSAATGAASLTGRARGRRRRCPRRDAPLTRPDDARGLPRPEPRPLQHEPLTRAVIGAAMQVHRALGPGYLESVYRHALAWELHLADVPVTLERRLQVRYRDAVVGEFVADMIVDERVIVELKVARAMAPAHEAQLLNYLTATGIEIGLLLNFGSERLQVRRITRTYRAAVKQTNERL